MKLLQTIKPLQSRIPPLLGVLRVEEPILFNLMTNKMKTSDAYSNNLQISICILFNLKDIVKEQQHENSLIYGVGFFTVLLG